jgi:O-antigen ligase
MRFNAHNVFIKAQFELGIIGIIPLLLWLIISFKKILNNQTEYKPLLLTLFLIILISFMQLSWIYSINLLVINAILINIAVLKRFETVDDDKPSLIMVS